MRRSRIAALLLPLWLLPAAAHAQGELTARTQPLASQIVCPVAELQWGIGQSLPDPWWSEPKTTTQGFVIAPLVGSSTGPYTTTAMGKEMVACRWADYGKTSYGPWPLAVSIGVTEPNTHIYMMRPATNTPPETWTCPSKVQVRVLTPLPAPWLGTTYQWSLSGKEMSIAAGAPVNMCQYSGMIPNEILYPIQTTAQAGMTGLASNPPPAIDQLAQAFLVTKAEVVARPAKGRMSCPVTVFFEVRIGANAAGTVRYRTEINGKMSMPFNVGFTGPGEKTGKHGRVVGPEPQQAGELTLTTQVQPSNVVTGQGRIIIESPQNIKESNVAKYEITCTPLAPAGNLAQNPPPSVPPPATLAAPTPSSDPAPAAIATAPQQPAMPVSQPQAVAAAAMTSAATAALPDLRIAGSEVNRARPTMLRVQVVNSGQAPSAPTRVRVFTPEGKSWYGAVPALSVGQEIWIVVRTDVPLSNAEKIYARVDDPDRVKELNEGNNDHEHTERRR